MDNLKLYFTPVMKWFEAIYLKLFVAVFSLIYTPLFCYLIFGVFLGVGLFFNFRLLQRLHYTKYRSAISLLLAWAGFLFLAGYLAWFILVHFLSYRLIP